MTQLELFPEPAPVVTVIWVIHLWPRTMDCFLCEREPATHSIPYHEEPGWEHAHHRTWVAICAACFAPFERRRQ
jgi:hypothetical protein